MVYEYFEHIADMGIIGKGNSLEEAFSEAAKAMFNIMTDIKKIKKTEKISFKISAKTEKELFIEFLNELLSLSDLKKIMFCEFKIKKELNSLNVTAFGEKLNNLKLNQEVKAATYSQIEVSKNGKEFIAKTVVDV